LVLALEARRAAGFVTWPRRTRSGHAAALAVLHYEAQVFEGAATVVVVAVGAVVPGRNKREQEERKVRNI